MEAEDEQQTQATQNIVDPRRRGQQYSGFSDDDISDIVCVLHPHSNHARREISRIAREGSQHIFGRDEVDNVDADFSLEDKASRFEMAPPSALGNHVIVLRLSAAMKDPNLGFTFGRNTARCDLCFAHDPCRRLSNIHFRIFVNEFGVVMLEDQSTNGTIVDTVLLKSKAQPPSQKKRMLTSGSRVKVLMHQEDMDLEFMIRIPRREGAYDAAYRDRLNDYFARLAALRSKPTTIAPGPGGPPNLFAAPSGQAAARRPPLLPNGRGSATPPANHRTRTIIPMEWDGSDKYNRVGVIGKGAFAVVYQVTSKSDGSPYAAKELEKRHFMKNGVLDQKVENEMNIMKELQHPNIVRYIEKFDWDDRLLIIIMEFIGGGDLGKFIHTQGPLPETVVQTMAAQLLDAFEYLHERGVTHRDVKPDNILISSMDPFEIKLTDFGLSKMVNNEETFLRTFCGTLLYCAPEVYTEFVEYDHFGRRNPRLRGRRAAVGQRYDHAVDVWSLGGVLFFALTGRPPYPVQSGVSYSELLHRIMTTDLDVTPLHRAGVSRDGIEFLRLMLQRRPEIRSTVTELKGHPWLGGPRYTVDPTESLDEITDEELPVDASQLSLEDGQAAQTVQADARPDSEILVNHNDSDGYSDTSEKENTIRGLRDSKTPQPLFGEVNVSAVGSSGGIPEHRLNLRVTDPSDSAAETVILDSQDPGSFDDSDHFTPHKRQPHEGGHLSVGVHNQSADQLQSLVENVQSQSLGGVESVGGGGSAVRGDATSSPPAPRVLVQPPEFPASKRKPNYDTSDEFEGGSGPGRPSFKRLKSDVDLDSLTDEMLEEYKLIASVPPVQRLESGRQIDRPVHKTTFWDRKDPGTHHVEYPEMTQLQLDVFAQAARERGERFEPGASPLWDLAMKYFPPTDWSAVEGRKENDPPRASTPQTLIGRDSRRLKSDAGAEIPSTAPVRVPSSSDEDSIPDTAPHDGNIIVPIREDPSQSRIVALFESAPESAVQSISIPVASPILSWGRGGDNTHVYGERSEARVPKCAFKALLYKEGYDASKDRDRQPWLRPRADEADFAFYLCTKATSGIWVNGRRLLSHDSRRPSSPAHHWVKLHTGDDLVVWGDPTDDGPKTRVVFKAFWGASAEERGEPPVAVHAGLARRLDEVCLRAERRIRSEGEYKARMEEAVGEHAVRERFVGLERGRSREFEGVRRGAVEVLSLARSVGRA